MYTPIGNGKYADFEIHIRLTGSAVDVRDIKYVDVIEEDDLVTSVLNGIVGQTLTDDALRDYLKLCGIYTPSCSALIDKILVEYTKRQSFDPN